MQSNRCEFASHIRLRVSSQPCIVTSTPMTHKNAFDDASTATAFQSDAKKKRYRSTPGRRTCFSTIICLCSAHGWSQLHTHGLSKPAQSHLGLAHLCVPASCSMPLCLQRQRSVQEPSATMKKKALQAQRPEQHLHDTNARR